MGDAPPLESAAPFENSSPHPISAKAAATTAVVVHATRRFDVDRRTPRASLKASSRDDRGKWDLSI
jgi:hypothetical protein